MFTKMKLALVMCASLVGIAAAAPAPSNPSADVAGKIEAKRAARAERKAQMLAKYDTNKDGKLDSTERAVMRDEMAVMRFKKLDLDGDGKVTLDEFKQAKAQLRHGRAGLHRHHHGQTTK